MPGFGTVLEAPRATVARLSEEHAIVVLDREDVSSSASGCGSWRTTRAS
jgi:hypothetical protein